MGAWSQPTTDDVLKLDVRQLRKQGLFDMGGGTFELHWAVGGERVISVHLCLGRNQLDFERDGSSQAVELVWTPCHYGGNRYWFLCPACRQRVGVLYLGQSGFLCRHCYGLAYASQFETDRERMIRKARKIRHKLGASLNLLEPIMVKPKWMRHATYRKLVRKESDVSSQVFSSLN